jgi:hypothetical protein
VRLIVPYAPGGGRLCSKSAVFSPGLWTPQPVSAWLILARLFGWRDALFTVQPKTMIRWQRAGRGLFWRWKFRPGRPGIFERLSGNTSFQAENGVLAVMPVLFRSWRPAVRSNSTEVSA